MIPGCLPLWEVASPEVRWAGSEPHQACPPGAAVWMSLFPIRFASSSTSLNIDVNAAGRRFSLHASWISVQLPSACKWWFRWFKFCPETHFSNLNATPPFYLPFCEALNVHLANVHFCFLGPGGSLWGV